MTPSEALASAWTVLAPNRDPGAAFPRGFWPDVARLACLMLDQQSLHPELNGWRPTVCSHGSWPEPAQTSREKSTGKISAAQKAANTAALLAALNAGAE